MAIVKCPHCGKEISDRSQSCPFCNAILIEHKAQETITKDMVKITTKDSLIGCICAAALSFAVYNLLGLIFSDMAVNYIGELAKEAINYITYSRLLNIGVILIIEMLFFCFLPLLFKSKPDIGYAAGIILSIIFCILIFCIQNVAKEPFPTGREDLANYCILYLRMNGLSLPLLQGALSLLSYGKNLKNAVLSDLFIGIVYFVISLVLGFFASSVFNMGISGIGFAQLITGIILFVMAIVKCDEMKKLIHK